MADSGERRLRDAQKRLASIASGSQGVSLVRPGSQSVNAETIKKIEALRLSSESSALQNADGTLNR